MSKSLNCKSAYFFLLLSISFLLITSNFSGTPNLKYQPDKELNLSSSNGFLSESKISTFSSTNIYSISRNFSYNISWDNSQIILTESTIFNSSTDLQIYNSTLFIAPPSPDTHVKITIGGESRLNITNSLIVVSSGFGSLNFYGIDAHITNSTIIGLGEYLDSPGLYFESSFLLISDSEFISGFGGVSFSNSIFVEIFNCTFQDINGIGGFGGLGVYGSDSRGINISNCLFVNVRSCLYFYFCSTIIITDNHLRNIRSGITINPNGRYSDINNVQIANNTFYNSSVGIQAVGSNIDIIKNSFLNMSITGLYIGGRDITIRSNTFRNSSRGILTPESLPSSEPNQAVSSSISNTYIEMNIFDNIASYCILLTNYEYPTVFSISDNNFTNIEVGIGFEGNIGGRNSIARSWVIRNIFHNISNYAIEGFPLEYLAHFQHTSFIQNAFFNCENEYASFQANYYYMDDIRWDDGFVGNYWDSFVDESHDEDNNSIGDNFYIVSVNHGQYDLAPLLSLDYIKQENITVSDHPSDLVRTKSELKGENATFTWIIRAEENSSVEVYEDGLSVQFSQNSSTIEVSLLSISLGLHNFTLVVSVGDQIYRDLVWIKILEDQVDLVSDILVPIGTGIFLIAISTVLLVSIKKKYSHN